MPTVEEPWDTPFLRVLPDQLIPSRLGLAGVSWHCVPGDAGGGGGALKIEKPWVLGCATRCKMLQAP